MLRSAARPILGSKPANRRDGGISWTQFVMLPPLRSRIVSIALAACLLAGSAAPGLAQEGRIRLLRDAEIEHTIRIYATPLFNAAGLDPSAISVYLIDDNRLNAFVAGGMNIFINSGLLMRSKDPLEVMGVIAHETGHIAGGHLARTQDALRTASIESILAAVLGAAAAVVGGGAGSDVGAAVITGGTSMAQRSLLQYSRAQEAAADQAGVSYLERAGYSSRGLLDFMGVLAGEEALLPDNQDPYLRSHPLTRERIDSLQNFVDHRSRFSDKPVPPELVAMHGRMLGKLIGYLEPLGRVLHRYPDSDQSLEARYARAIAYYRASDTQKSLNLLDQLQAEYPEDAYFWELRGQILFENGRIGELVEAYQKSVDLDPTEPLLRLGLAQSQLETERPELAKPALAHLEEVVRREPRNSFAWRLLAIAYGRTDQLGMAALALSEFGACPQQRIGSQGAGGPCQPHPAGGQPRLAAGPGHQARRQAPRGELNFSDLRDDQGPAMQSFVPARRLAYDRAPFGCGRVRACSRRRGGGKRRMRSKLTGLGLWLAPVLALYAAVPAPARSEEPLTPEQKEAVEGVVRDYLLSHPEVVRDALIQLQRRQEEEQQASRREAIAELQDYAAALPADFVKGDPKAETSVIEFFDYRCPYCKAVAPRIDEVVADDASVRVVLIEFPILGEESKYASRAAIASRFQGKYMAFHDAMMAHRGNLDDETVLDLAEDAGIDIDKLKEDMASPEVEALIQRHYQLADKLGVTGTPAFVIGQELVPGAIDTDTIKAKIKQARQS